MLITKKTKKHLYYIVPAFAFFWNQTSDLGVVAMLCCLNYRNTVGIAYMEINVFFSLLVARPQM